MQSCRASLFAMLDALPSPGINIADRALCLVIVFFVDLVRTPASAG